MMRDILFVGILVWSLSCSQDTNPVSPIYDSDFAIYFLKDSSLRTGEVNQRPLAELELAVAPWLDLKDILFYDFSTHCIYLKNDKATLFENYASGHFEPLLTDKPFVVVAGGSRCYLGSLHSGALSTRPPGPYIDELDVWYFPKDVLHISQYRLSSEEVRSDARIRDTLIRSGLFHEGLSLELNAVTVVINADTSTVQYRFTLKNNDRDPLYVIDSDRTGSELFHYYTNGVVFSRENYPSIWSEYKTVTAPNPYDSWQPSWFTRLESNQSMQRTVTLRGYPRIPQDQYACRLTYSGPRRIDRAQRNLVDSRYWIGDIESNTFVVVVN